MSASVYDRIAELPVLSTHEHIGCLPSSGSGPNVWGFRVDAFPGSEVEHTCLLDLLLSPYFRWFLASAGCPVPPERLYGALPEPDQRRIFELIAPYLRESRASGLFLALDTALQDLYQVNLKDLLTGRTSWWELSGRIRENYGRGLSRWASDALRRCGMRRAIKLVHVSYLTELADGRTGASYATESSFFEPVLRVDDLMGYPFEGTACSFEHIGEYLDVEISDTDSADEAVVRAFALVDRFGLPAVKQAQAYFRPLSFRRVSREDAEPAFHALGDGASDEKTLAVVKDYIGGRILDHAASRGLPYQVHTGMVNLPTTNPVLLTSTIDAHPDVDFVLLHCYPYLSEAGYLARTKRNVYLDAAWLTLQSPTVLRQALSEWIGLVPSGKIFLSGDATSVEEAYGAAVWHRRVLAAVLDEKVAHGEFGTHDAVEIAEGLLGANAARLYPALAAAIP